ncbi:MAG: uroporphyrin-III C/tetrapyrrole (Corrin/Porphyrin) methyltransferase, rRNA [Candidatus Parcubacteria bacterium]|jgi:16S rRNA (cytidine1402-2'-O)-methyltransferase
MSTLYVVATPIGNLEDITLRALRILKEVDLVLCEDTRVTKKLLSHFDIHTPTMSFHANSTLAKVDQIIAQLQEGKNLALVTDAGTPAISDPGSLLVSKVKEAMGEEVKIVSVPGASALTAALSIAGLPVHEFTFIGFLPHKKGRETLFKQIFESERAIVLYESPHRIMKTLESLASHAVSSAQTERKITIAREITKIFEEIVSGTAAEMLHYYTSHEDKVRGEFVVIIGPRV